LVRAQSARKQAARKKLMMQELPEENYSVASMDLEHLAQLAMLNDIKAAVRGGVPDSMVYALLDELVEKSNLHFLSEQLVMKLHAYEAYESHLLEHQRLLAELKDLKRNLTEGAANAKQGLIEALRSWLLVHIQTSDKALAEYMSARTTIQEP
jgi:hemerythrin-like metal-binding protein